MKKISAMPKKRVTKIPSADDNIRFDEWRRLRNALIALAALDAGWIVWVERHVPSRMMGTGGQPDPRIARRVVERQARNLVMRGYSFLGAGFTKAVIESDCYFTDDGNLKMYL